MINKLSKDFGLICHYPIDFADPATHVKMLQNIDKYQCFSQALRRSVKDKMVLDIGAGSGILTILSLAHGARFVVAVERPSVCQITSSVLSCLPSYQHKTQIVSSDIFDFNDNLGKFDVITSETIGYLGFEENIAAILALARRQFANSSTVLMPQSLQILMEPITTLPVKTMNEPFLTTQCYNGSSGTLTSVCALFKLGTEPPHELRIENIWKSHTSQVLKAASITFRAVLGEGIVLTNRSNKYWPCCVIPFQKDVTLHRESPIRISLNLTPSGKSYLASLELFVDDIPIVKKSFAMTDIRHEMEYFPHTNVEVAEATIRLMRTLGLPEKLYK